jgi:hypothetical protein
MGDSGVPSRGQKSRVRPDHSRRPPWESAATSNVVHREWHRPRRIPGRRSNRASVVPGFHRQSCQALVRRDVAGPRTAWRAGPGFSRACYELVNASPSEASAPIPPAPGAKGPNCAARVVRLRRPPADRLLKSEKEGVPAGTLRSICRKSLGTLRNSRE